MDNQPPLPGHDPDEIRESFMFRGRVIPAPPDNYLLADVRHGIDETIVQYTLAWTLSPDWDRQETQMWRHVPQTGPAWVSDLLSWKISGTDEVERLVETAWNDNPPVDPNPTIIQISEDEHEGGGAWNEGFINLEFGEKDDDTDTITGVLKIDFTKVGGYDATEHQYFKNEQGTFKWVTAVECP